MRSMFENLERRQLLASAVLSGSVLTVRATNEADVISISHINSKTISVGLASQSGTTSLVKNFAAKKVKTIRVYGLGGNDYITAGALRKGTNLTIDGGAGDDILIGSINGVDTLVGGAGKDILTGGSGTVTFNTRGDGAVDSITGKKGSSVSRDSRDRLFLS